MNSPHLLIATLVALLLASGCAVGPDYARPTIASPTTWAEGTALPDAKPVLPPEWWRVFNDPELDALEARAIDANQDLKRAVARVAEARSLARVAGADRFPSVTGGASYTRIRSSENRDTPSPDLDSDDLVASFDLSYELDVFGRVRRSHQAATADALAVESDLQVVLLTLTADVASHYYLLRSLDDEYRVIEATRALREDAVRLQETRFRAGLINDIDVARARTELATVEADGHATLRARAQREHALAVLCGVPPSTFTIARVNRTPTPPVIPPGMPSSLLERRPDIAEAEHVLQADCARIGIAQAAFFPTITLTSTAGLASADLGTFVIWPSRVASIGPSISFPVFQGRRNRASLEAATARWDQSLATYRATILNAFREVEDALSDIRTLASQGEAVGRALVAARDTATLATDRYQTGLSSYLEVVDAQRIALLTERQESLLRGQRMVAAILLAKAVGGGWMPCASPSHP